MPMTIDLFNPETMTAKVADYPKEPGRNWAFCTLEITDEAGNRLSLFGREDDLARFRRVAEAFNAPAAPAEEAA